MKILEKSLKAEKESDLLKDLKQLIKDEQATLKAENIDKKSHDPMPLVKRIYERLIRAGKTELAEEMELSSLGERVWCRHPLAFWVEAAGVGLLQWINLTVKTERHFVKPHLKM